MKRKPQWAHHLDMKTPWLRLVLVAVVVFLPRCRSSQPSGGALEGIANDDRMYAGTRYAEVRDAVFANPYPPPYERFPVTLGSLLRGALPFGEQWQFLAAARRTVASNADLRGMFSARTRASGAGACRIVPVRRAAPRDRRSAACRRSSRFPSSAPDQRDRLAGGDAQVRSCTTIAETRSRTTEEATPRL